MARVSVSTIVRDILSKNLEMPADDVMKLAKQRGVDVPDKALRGAVHNVRNSLRKTAAAEAAPASNPSASPPVSAPLVATLKPAPAIAPKAAVPTDNQEQLTNVLEKVAAAHLALQNCGGLEGAIKVVDAIKKCGGVDEFLKNVEVVSRLSQ